MAAVSAFPTARHKVYYPQGMHHNTDLVKWAASNGCHVYPVAGGYMARNDVLVAKCDILVAFPAQEKELTRSGTWATVRRGRKAKKKVIIRPFK